MKTIIAGNRRTLNRVAAWILEDRTEGELSGPPNKFRASPQFPSRGHGMSSGAEWHEIRFGNDAFDVWVSCKHSGEVASTRCGVMAAEDFRKLALWYLWRWAWGEWFGLRRRLYFAWLGWHLNHHFKRVNQGEL